MILVLLPYAEPQYRVFIVREGVKVCGLGKGQRYWVLTGIKPMTSVSPAPVTFK